MSTPENYYKLYQAFQQSTGVAVDSRTLLAGQLFFALNGATCDGHDFLNEVAAKKAYGAVVRDGFTTSIDLPLFCVADPLQALQELAKLHLSWFSGTIVAVTGSVGKTTTKEFIKTLLSQRYRCSASYGSQNSQIGLPLSILNHVQGHEEFLVLEMGMTERGNIQRLVDIAPPHIAVITQVSLSHAAAFATVEAIADEKAAIMAHPRTQRAILNADMDSFARTCAYAPKDTLSFSMHGAPDAHYTIEPSATGATVRACSETIALAFPPFPVAHLYSNALAAIVVARTAGIAWETIEPALAQLAPYTGRLSIVEKKGILFIDDTYNASELSSRSAFDCLAAQGAAFRKIAVFGQMAELGNFSERCHYNVGQYALDRCDHLICLGSNCSPMVELWQRLDKPVAWFLRFDELLAYLRMTLMPRDRVLLKGSRGLKLERILEAW